MTESTCATCKWWERYGIDGLECEGWCPEQHQDTLYFQTCGEHTPKEQT